MDYEKMKHSQDSSELTHMRIRGMVLVISGEKIYFPGGRDQIRIVCARAF